MQNTELFMGLNTELFVSLNNMVLALFILLISFASQFTNTLEFYELSTAIICGFSGLIFAIEFMMSVKNLKRKNSKMDKKFNL